MKESHAQCPKAMWKSTKEFQLPIIPHRYGTVLKGAHSPLLRISVVVHMRSPTAHCSPSVWQCIEGVPLPIATKECGGAQKEFYCPLP